MRLKALVAKYSAVIQPFPTSIIEENGGIYSRNRPAARRAYWTQDLKRWSRLRGKPMILDDRPTLGDPTPASFMVLAAIADGEDWVSLTRALQEAFWLHARDIGDAEVRRLIANGAGLDGEALLRRELDADVQSMWTDNHETARSGGVFGFPTFRYDGQLYWGQDSLPFLERHLNGEPLV